MRKKQRLSKSQPLSRLHIANRFNSGFILSERAVVAYVVFGFKVVLACGHHTLKYEGEALPSVVDITEVEGSACNYNVHNLL